VKVALVDRYLAYRQNPSDTTRDLLLGQVGLYAAWLYRGDSKMQPETRQDLAQETVIKVMLYLDRFEDRSSITTWVHRIAHGIRCDHYRKHRHDKPVPPDTDLAKIAGPNHKMVDQLPAFLLDDPIAREIMDETKVATIQQNFHLSKTQYYRHLNALGKKLELHNVRSPATTRV
jgi:DNA-directed RNA polymerase specialized sigma24 family protein